MVSALIPASLAASDGVKPYNGLVGADSPVYDAKLFWQNLEEALAGNSNVLLQKQMAHAEERLDEAYAAMLANNTHATDIALKHYQHQLDRINKTLDSQDIDEDLYLNVSEQFAENEYQLGYLANNTTTPEQYRNRWMDATSETQKFKNGRPFIYFNNTSYFIPPGHVKNDKLISIPEGLAKKGFVIPEPVILEDGTSFWPWEDVNGTFNHPYKHDLNKTFNNTRFKDNNKSLKKAQGKDQQNT